MAELRNVLKPSGDPEIHESKTGTGDDFQEIRADGTVRLKGKATAWKDMVADLFAKKLYSNVGKLDYDWENNALKFQSGGDISDVNDRVQGNQEINHEFKVGTVFFKPHLHWFQEVVSGVQQISTLTLEWRLQRNGFLREDNWTTTVANTGLAGDDILDFSDKTNGFYNQLTRFPDINVTCAVSDTIQFRMARTDSNGGDVAVYFFDLHGMVDSFGSDDEIAKVN